MGSTGGDNFGDYNPPSVTKCDRSVDARLEEVARQDYFRTHKKTPAVQTLVRLRRGVGSGGRLVVEDAGSGTAIGLLPTRLHYLLVCQEGGYAYEGTVTAAHDGKVPLIEVHLDPV